MRAPYGHKNHRRRGLAGFSLIELLVVVAILGILLALVAPPAAEMLRASGVTNAGDQLLTALSQARQTAVSRNRTVEVRLYRYVDSTQPDEPAEGKFRSIQSFLIDPMLPTAGSSPLGRVQKFAGSTFIASNAALSSILGDDARPTVAGTSLGHPISPCGLDYEAARIQFYPDGSTDLAMDQLWFLTVVSERTPDSLSTPPENFATLVIQPSTGKAQLHRPK